MTGYGCSERAGDDQRIRVEMRSVNQRFLDVQIKAPRTMLQVEDRIRKLIESVLARGRVTVYIEWKSVADEGPHGQHPRRARAHQAAQAAGRRALHPGGGRPLCRHQVSPDIRAGIGTARAGRGLGGARAGHSGGSRRARRHARRRGGGTQGRARRAARRHRRYRGEADRVVSRGGGSGEGASDREDHRAPGRFSAHRRDAPRAGGRCRGGARGLHGGGRQARRARLAVTRVPDRATSRSASASTSSCRRCSGRRTPSVPRAVDIGVTGPVLSLKEEIEKLREQVQNVE